MSGYESRPQQIEMALAIQSAVDENSHLVVEAGTGIGKSFAYSVPFILNHKTDNKPVIISTYTKTLQEQLINKDLPFIENVLSHYEKKFTYALCVGSENYLCLRRMRQTSQQELFDSKQQSSDFQYIVQWSKASKTGLYLDLSESVSFEVWARVCREPDLCLSKNCQFSEHCFYTKAILKMFEADIIVCNHHLFFLDFVSGGKILPQYDNVVFDEAHNLEEIASSLLGIDISNFQTRKMLDHLYAQRTNKGLLNRIKKSSITWFTNTRQMVMETDKEMHNFFMQVQDLVGKENVRRLRTPELLTTNLSRQLHELSGEIKEGIPFSSSLEEETELRAYAERFNNLSAALKSFITQKMDNHVYWAEIQEKIYRGRRVTLKSAPIDVSGMLREKLFSQPKQFIFTSATLSINKSFEYYRNRLGIDKANELLLDSSFDYANRTLLYIPHDIPDPQHQSKQYQQKVIEKITETLEVTQGSTFVLFTSYEMLNMVYDHISSSETGLKYFKQGELSKFQMLKKFKQTKNAVLLGTDTFWQGIDVPGDSLICVIITRLPFDVPNHPIIEARREYLQQQGKNPFLEYILPQAVIMFRQGFGRLIRTKQDWGIVAVFDPRIMTRNYGSNFMNSLPPISMTDSLSQVERFVEFFSCPKS